ncbi:hypothetical protein FNV43_RR27195 [Rhamnella rubrinervis]|uniref:ADP-ribosyl cyclase/cyclic ADP-ribose hydrolase n=1 Tax=Rhamnella rubrinervis TaxID=2594499 RepID=A0A8K0DK48_9ROSA|nr:hypothetical protein FNV43_RR27195 [Rhamnella rubrinervis]
MQGASSSSVSPLCKYDVFLSFRGEDTRKSFTDHLYAAMERKGIVTFRDDERLERGKPISQEIFRAIEESRFSIVIFSRNFASSTWCLDEVAKIVECMKVMGQIVIPVFYHVDPSEVRKQEGSFGDAFIRHQQNFKENVGKVEKWRDAFAHVANVSGWDLRDRHESKLIQEIVERIFNTVFCAFSRICGMGGIGKTTLAEDKLLSEILMEKSTTLWDSWAGANKIKKGLHFKRVLLVLDDVDRLDQLKALAAEHDSFGLGSRIIITTRDEHLLITHGVDNIFKLKGLNHCAALEVLGSFLFGRSIEEWKSALDRLKEVPNREILDVLRISYDGLEEMEKKIFLDIACFFRGKEKDRVIPILDSCGFNPVIGIRVLIDKSLITLSDNKLWMHDMLQEMGRAIVYQESPEEPCKRSRLWHCEDVEHVLVKNMGMDAVEALIVDDQSVLTEALWNDESYLHLDHFIRDGIHCNPKALSIMSKLRLLKILEKLRFINLSNSHNLIRTPDFTGVPNLERLVLESCTNLLEVHPSISSLKRLTLLNLKYCFRLRSLPSKIETESLEILILSCCTQVKKLPEFGVNMKHLSELCMTSLKRLNLNSCSKLQELPENMGDMECLEELNVSRTAIWELPSSITLLKNLKVLSFCGLEKSGPAPTRWYKRFTFRQTPRREGPMGLLLPSLSGLSSLRELNLSNCNLSDGAIPSDLGCLSSLRKLNLKGNNFSSLPASVCQLSKLTILDLESCRRLQSLPDLPLNIQYMKIQDCTSLETSSDLLKLGNLSEPTISCINCFKLVRNDDCNQVLHAMFKRYIQGLSYLRSRFDIILPGSRIPEWFNQRCTGSSVVIHLPPDCYDAKFAGFSLCTVFVVKEHLRKRIYSNAFFGSYTHKLGCHIKMNGHTSSRTPIFWFKEELDNIDLNDDSQHLWLLYLSRHYFGTTWQNNCNHIEFSFEVEGPGLEVKQSGAYLVYEEDAENFHKLMNNRSRSSDISIYDNNLDISE